jgi:hypothetical protein
MTDDTRARIDDVAPGDILLVDRHGEGEKTYKVVHLQASDAGFLVTLEDDADAETFDVDLAAGTPVRRLMESKWESADSPTAEAVDPTTSG